MTDRSVATAVRRIDPGLGERTPPDERLVQRLVTLDDGTGSCAISWIRTPAGGGSPEGLHTHPVDQIIFVLEGLMTVEIRGRREQIRPGSLALFPAGIAHRNWNAGPAPSVHLVINAPAPSGDVPFVTRVSGT
jgi:quercetin dioxygenase-like cupin family protein